MSNDFITTQGVAMGHRLTFFVALHRSKWKEDLSRLSHL